MLNTEATPNVKSIGETLKEARTKSGLSVADAAAKLHLAERYIEGIEADDLISLPQSLIFKRGYIRSYARLLNISDEYIQQLLHAQGLIEVPIVKKIVQPEKKQITVGDNRVRWISYGIGALFIVLLLSWWRSQVNVHHDAAVKAPISDEMATPAAPAPTAEITKSAAVEPVKNEQQVKEKNSDKKTVVTAKAPVTDKKENSVASAPASVTVAQPEKIKPITQNNPNIETKKRAAVVNNLNFDPSS